MEMKTLVCANFGVCRTVLKTPEECVKIGRYTFCKACAETRTK